MDSKLYTYFKSDVLNNKISYSYSEYQGMDFILNWKKFRKKYIIDFNPSDNFNISFISNILLLDSIKQGSFEYTLNEWILSFNNDSTDYERINLLLKRFEVTKRIYSNYDENFRSIAKDDHKNLLLYLKFGFVLILAFTKTNKLQYLNALLKLNDILCSMFEFMTIEEKKMFSRVIEKELFFVDRLMTDNNI